MAGSNPTVAENRVTAPSVRKKRAAGAYILRVVPSTVAAPSASASSAPAPTAMKRTMLPSFLV